MPGPANLYGVANAPGIITAVLIPSDVVLNPGIETTIVDSGPLIAPSQGWFYPVIWTQLFFQFGATLPSNTFCNAKVGSGSDFFQYGFNNATLVANATQVYYFWFAGPASQAPWTGAGSHVFVTAQANTTAATVSHFGTMAWFGLFRAPDQ